MINSMPGQKPLSPDELATEKKRLEKNLIIVLRSISILFFIIFL
jgi:hypothetical protein